MYDYRFFFDNCLLGSCLVTTLKILSLLLLKITQTRLDSWIRKCEKGHKIFVALYGNKEESFVLAHTLFTDNDCEWRNEKDSQDCSKSQCAFSERNLLYTKDDHAGFHFGDTIHR